jgi:hypothetical protein
MRQDDESSISEIDILPDGRLCLFGASQQILEVLEAIALGEPALERRIECLRRMGAQQPPESNGACSIRNDETVNTQ